MHKYVHGIQSGIRIGESRLPRRLKTDDRRLFLRGGPRVEKFAFLIHPLDVRDVARKFPFTRR
ncbi:MAG: hypothetical protein ACPLRH_04350, partial [Desulfotomaculales bacterium]